MNDTVDTSGAIVVNGRLAHALTQYLSENNPHAIKVLPLDSSRGRLDDQMKAAQKLGKRVISAIIPGTMVLDLNKLIHQSGNHETSKVELDLEALKQFFSEQMCVVYSDRASRDLVLQTIDAAAEANRLNVTKHDSNAGVILTSQGALKPEAQKASKLLQEAARLSNSLSI